MTKSVWTLARKEMTELLNAPATYVIAVVFLVINGWLFASALFQMNQSTLDPFVRPLPLIFTFLVPALTMRAFSEEFKGGTIEYLSTLPLEDYEIVAGKYLASLGLIGLLVAFTLLYPLVLFVIGRPDVGQIVGTYASIMGLAVFFAAIGLFASALTRNQVVAFIIGFFICFVFFLLGRMAEFLPGLLAGFVRNLSVEEHFDSLARGVLDTRDLLYWVTGGVFFLVATWVVLRKKRTITSAAGLGMVAIIALLVNVLGNWVYLRLDLTQRHAYSLSASSKKLVRSLSDPVIVKAYFTPDLPPPYNLYERYVRDLLTEYRSASHGKVRFEFILQSPPEVFEKKAAEAGLMPIQFEQMASDQMQIRRGYMGLVLFHRDKSEAMPIIKNIEQLEYDLTSRIAKMAVRTKKVIAVTSGRGETNWQNSQSKLAADLSELYELRDTPLSASTTGPIQADALLVVGPKQKFDDKSLWAIDQTIMRGIPAAFLVDIKNFMPERFFVTPVDPGLNDFLRHYGIDLGDRLVYDAQCETIGVTQNMGGFAFSTNIRYPYFPLMDRILNTHPIGRDLDTVGLAFPTTVDPVQGIPPTVHFSPLLYTSPKSWLAKAEPYASVAPNNIPQPRPDDPHGPYSVAGVLEGTFSSYFAGKPVPVPNQTLMTTSPTTQIVVVGSAHVLDPNMPAFPGDDALVSNMLAYLTKDETLLGIRSKGEIIRPLKPVPNAVRQIVQYGVVLGAAFLPIALGIWRWRARERWRRMIASAFAPLPAAVPPVEPVAP
jgi:gliding-associated putative ABC transporter substrate-binding component GldG